MQKNLGSIGSNREELNADQRAELDKASAAQHKLQERTNQLLDKMQRVSKDREEKDPETARELKNAVEQATSGNVTGLMGAAKEQIEQNKLRNAGDTQRQAIDKLEKFVKELEDRREAELDRLAKKLRQLEKKMDDLADRQEALQKKAKDAQQIVDPMKREEELKRLARDQQQLQQEAQEMAKQLSRLRSERASQSLAQAAGQMGQAAQQMQAGQNPDENQDEALDRLDDAQRELERARENAEEELQREQLAKIADAIRRIAERQEAQIAESARVQREVLQNKKWTRSLLFSLADAARSQKGLGDETKRLAEEKLSNAPVFSRILGKSAQAMEQASERMLERRKQASQNPDETAADAEVARLQQEAMRRLQQLLDVLKTAEAAAGPRGGQGGGQPGGGGGQGGAENDGIPALAQYKLLRNLQAEVNQRTEDFGKQHPDPKKYTDKEKAELQEIRREQQEIASLLEELTPSGAPEGGNP